MNSLVNTLKRQLPAVTFEKAKDFKWSHKNQTIYYTDNGSPLLLLHEAGHALCQHRGFTTDHSLIKMEMEAWTKAKELGKQHNIEIDEDYIQDCLDSYREWQHQRSACPTCTLTGAETDSGQYRCFNCGHQWHVTKNTQCRIYRKSPLS